MVYDLKNLYHTYSRCMVKVVVTNYERNMSIGSGFHIGDGLIVTASHVLKNNHLKYLETESYNRMLDIYKIHFHQDPKVDLAVIETNFNTYHSPPKKSSYVPQDGDVAKAAEIPVGYHLNDWIGNEFLLSKVLVLGYPPIPGAKDALLVSVAGEVNAIVDTYFDDSAPYFVISSIARGGFSGGPVISEYGFLLGVVTDALVNDFKSPESGFFAILSIEPLISFLEQLNKVPQDLFIESSSL